MIIYSRAGSRYRTDYTSQAGHASYHYRSYALHSIRTPHG